MYRTFVSGVATAMTLALTLSSALACGPDGHDHGSAPEKAQAISAKHMQVAQAGAGHNGHQGGNPTPATQNVVKIGALQIEDTWSRATPNAAKVAAGYMRITNTGTTPDWLTGGSFTRAARMEIHEMAVKDGVMTMRPLPDGIEILPGQTITLAPGSYHAMFMGLKEPLKEGETVSGTLEFKNAGKADVSYTVRSLAAGGSRKH
ncbi:copper chaperone PCu(A)C [Castellaniella sp.]|uniref:copper chaperone PCu(A)C n=1 Tax=Castellaniella sp. TaxID=1955812 RepID=UPI002AFE2334|nr:copper chaperone PCu(A)C [Castellaniella sp.]